MPTLFFKKQYMQMIRAGEKTSTIRAFSSVKAGDDVVFLSGRDKIRAKVLSVEHLPVEKITSEMAQTDGFKSKKELLETLLELYPDQVLDAIYYIRFKINS